jgi:hypothetical protein
MVCFSKKIKGAKAITQEKLSWVQVPVKMAKLSNFPAVIVRALC